MKYLVVFALLLVMAVSSNAQVSSHAPTGSAGNGAPASSAFDISDRAVAKVNGAILTDRDLLREMLQIFPYARQHNGFPKEQESSIRQGALQMIIFEELVFQEAQRRKLIVPSQQLRQAESDFKKQFNSAAEYQRYVLTEMGGKAQAVPERIKRSLLIDEVLKRDVENRSTITLSEARDFYDKNPGQFQRPESFTFQSISVLPTQGAASAANKDGMRRTSDYLKQAKATRNYQEFGLLAEKVSEDDFRVNMGDHKSVEKDKLPPQVLKALSSMRVGQVSDLIQIEQAYTIVRLNAHNPAQQVSFESVKSKLMTDLRKAKYEKLRSGLDKKLHAAAKIELL